MMPPRPVVGVSLKAYFERSRLAEWLEEVARRARDEEWAAGVDAFVLPDLLGIPAAVAALAGTGLAVGAQDVSARSYGATTGDVPAARLADEGCTLTAVGHAERRALHHETDQDVAAKVEQLCGAGLLPLVCVGEESGDVDSAVARCRAQLATALRHCPEEQPVLVAYEPVWAIGAREAASPEHVRAVLSPLRAEFADRPMRYLYGGSAGPGVLTGLQGVADGVFLGRLAHDPAALSAVVAESRRAPTNPS